MHGSPERAAALARGLVGRFAPVTDATYDDIRGMAAAVERAGLLVHERGE